MKKKWRLLLFVSLLTLGFVFADFPTIVATITDIEVVLNGNVLQLTDVNGTEVKPLVVDGTTYLPIRAIGENLGLNVQWDETTRTVLLDDHQVKETLQAQIKDYLKQKFDKRYKPVYESLSYQVSDYNEVIVGNSFTATFLWTMHHLDSGGDVQEDAGKATVGNYSLQVKGTLDDGKLTSDIKVFSSNTAVGPEEYTYPLDFETRPSIGPLSITGYIRNLDLAARTVEMDKVFWLDHIDNIELLNDLGIASVDYPDGFYIYNPEPVYLSYSISDQVVIKTFETSEENPMVLVETRLEQLAEVMNERRVLFEVVIKDYEIIQLTEVFTP